MLTLNLPTLVLLFKSVYYRVIKILLQPVHYFSYQINKRPTLWLICIVITIKVTHILFAYFNYDFISYPWENWASIWSRWDSKVYLTIASDGYLPKSAAPDYIAFLSHFPPLYPMAIKFISDMLYLSPIYSGIIISVTASVAASYFLFKLVIFDFNNLKTAFLSVVFMNIYPISYFTLAVYSESLFIFFIILSFYLIRKERFIGGGLGWGGSHPNSNYRIKYDSDICIYYFKKVAKKRI